MHILLITLTTHLSQIGYHERLEEVPQLEFSKSNDTLKDAMTLRITLYIDD